MVSEHRESVPGYMQQAALRSDCRGLGPPFTPLMVHEGKPMIIDVEEFQYLCKCSHWDMNGQRDMLKNTRNPDTAQNTGR